MSLDDVSELLVLEGDPEDAEDVQTLGGLAMTQLGRVPTAGDRFSWAGREFEVLDMDGRRVDKVLALPPSGDRSAGESL
jgi:putative hemolysin